MYCIDWYTNNLLIVMKWERINRIFFIHPDKLYLPLRFIKILFLFVKNYTQPPLSSSE